MHGIYGMEKGEKKKLNIHRKKIFSAVSLNLSRLSHASVAKIFFFLCSFVILELLVSPIQAQEWVGLPPAPLFKTLIGAPREPTTGITTYLSQTRYEGEVGDTFEFLRYSPPDHTQWGWGVFGQGTILLDENGATFPMRGGDWHAGMYLSEASGSFSHRVEFEHQSSHLGDSLQGARNPIFFSRENFNLTSSFQPSDQFRLYAGIGDWENMYPAGDPFFCSMGCEIYSPAGDVGGTFLRGYFTADFQWKGEAGGSLNKNLELGIQWKYKKGENRDVRLALVYYNGNSDFGQFYRDPDEHWAVGVYFDP
jgi:hypothetical protein